MQILEFTPPTTRCTWTRFLLACRLRNSHGTSARDNRRPVYFRKHEHFLLCHRRVFCIRFTLHNLRSVTKGSSIQYSTHALSIFSSAGALENTLCRGLSPPPRPTWMVTRNAWGRNHGSWAVLNSTIEWSCDF